MSDSPRPCTGVLLAAGAGSRLGLGPKALLPFRGLPLVSHVAAELHDGGCHRVVVVLGSGASEVAPLVAGFEAVLNLDWASGMGSSFRVGVSTALAGESQHDDVTVALVDQPGVSAAMVSRLLARHAAPTRAGEFVTAAGFTPSSSAGALVRGHPIVFSCEAARKAANFAEGDAGARAFLKANPGLVNVVDCSDLGDGRDIDVMENLHLLG